MRSDSAPEMGETMPNAMGTTASRKPTCCTPVSYTHLDDAQGDGHHGQQKTHLLHAVAQHRLQIERDEHAAAQADEHHQPGEQIDGEQPVAKQNGVNDRLRVTALDEEQSQQEEDAKDEQPQRLRAGETLFLARCQPQQDTCLLYTSSFGVFA